MMIMTIASMKPALTYKTTEMGSKKDMKTD